MDISFVEVGFNTITDYQKKINLENIQTKKQKYP